MLLFLLCMNTKQDYRCPLFIAPYNYEKYSIFQFSPTSAYTSLMVYQQDPDVEAFSITSSQSEKVKIEVKVTDQIGNCRAQHIFSPAVRHIAQAHRAAVDTDGSASGIKVV